MHLLPVSLAPLAAICSKNSARMGTDGVSLSVANDNTFTAMATDGRQGILVTGPCEGLAADYPSIPALDASPNGETASIIPAAEWKRAFTDAAKLTTRTKPSLRTVPVVIGKQVTSFGATDLERVSFSQPRNIEGRFPNLSAAIPEGKPYATFEADPYQLANVLEIVGKLGTTNELKRVTIELHQPKGHRGTDCTLPAVIRTIGATPLSVVALVMPLTVDKKKKKDEIEDQPAEYMTDDDKRLHGAKMLIEELQRKLTAAEEKADYHRNNVEELRASDRIGAIEQVKAELWQIINERTAERDANQRQIEELQTDLENARTEQEEQAGSEMAKLRERAEDAEKELAKLEKEIDDTEYANVPQMLAEIHKYQDKAADLENAMAIEGVRLTTAWKRIEQLERVNGLLRSNFDRMIANLK